MKFTIKRAELVRGLRHARRVADAKGESTMPILGAALLWTQGTHRLNIAATDLTVFLTVALHSENALDGAAAVSARTLVDIAKAASGEGVTVTHISDTSEVEVQSGTAVWRLSAIPRRDFPKIPDHREVSFSEVKAEVIREMIDRTFFSICDDETQPHIRGALFESDGKTARMVSTDRCRLSKVERELPSTPALNTSVIIPKKGVSEFKRVIAGADMCGVAVQPPHVFVTANDAVLAVQLTDREFVPYSHTIPRRFSKRAVIDRLQLLAACKRATAMLLQQSPYVREVEFTIRDSTFTVACTSASGQYREDIVAECKGSDITLSVNPAYVIHLLTQITSECVTVSCNSPCDVLQIQPHEDPTYLGIVMPMRRQ